MLIFFCVTAVIFTILALAHVKVRIGYDGELSFVVKYLFIKVDITKIIEKSRKKPKKEKEPKEKQKKAFDTMGQLFRLISKAVSKITKTITIENLSIDMIVGTGDAMSTAMLWGSAYAASYAFDPLLSSNFKVIKKHIKVEPRFEQEVFEIDAKLWIRARTVSLLAFAASMAIAYLKIRKSMAETEKKSKPGIEAVLT